MRVVKGGAALCTAAERWGSARALDGRGPGRHPYQERAPGAGPRPLATRYLLGKGFAVVCAVCAKNEDDPVHRPPKRRKCATFAKSVAPDRPGGPGKTA